eukprot:gene6691-4789_t
MGILEYVIGLRRRPANNSVLFTGLDNAGKTTILRFLTGDKRATAAVPTQGFTIKYIKVAGIKLQVFDVGGSRDVRPYWRQYYSEAAAIVFVLDSSNPSRLGEAYEELQFVLEEEKLQQAPLLVYANKQDRMDAATPEEIARGIAGADLRSHPWKIQCCSGVTGDGVQEGIEWLLTQMK